MVVTAYENIYSKKPYHISVDQALQRVKTGKKSYDQVMRIRAALDKERANGLKQNLPCICFSGKFIERIDSALIEHSGFIVLDFDDVENVQKRKQEIIGHDFIYACWISPSEKGVKALARIADGAKHREHFTALRDVFPDADKSGINVSRVCYESFDPEIYINRNATQFKRVTKFEQVVQTSKIDDSLKVFESIVKWLSNRGDAFVRGERNTFIFKLAGACCRFGMPQSECLTLCLIAYTTHDNSFSQSECERTVKSAYRSNTSSFNTAEFSKDILVDRKTNSEVDVQVRDEDFYNPDIKPKDVIYGEDVKEMALGIYDRGYENVTTMGLSELDEYFKLKKREITLLTGIGNYGKSTFLKFLLMMKAILFGDKFAVFGPEDYPAEEFYNDLVEMILGCDCTPKNQNRPSREKYDETYDWVSKYFFYVYPKELAPTPDYIKERFLELIIKEGVTGCVVDPFNQMSNDYGRAGGRSDKYLEVVLSDFSRFAQLNDQYFIVVAHPKSLHKGADGNYPCPDVFDIADGAMWNNKMDNIIVYNRPNHQIDPHNPMCELHTKKIRRQKSVGKKGILQFELSRGERRYYFNGVDYMRIALTQKHEGKQQSLYESLKQEMESNDIF